MSRVLLIDDEGQMRRLLRLALESRGFEVRDAPDGQLGLEAAAFWRPEVVVLDLGLPDMDGQTVLQRLRGFSDVPVLVLSVRSQEEVKVAALNGGADDFLTKPFGMNELVARLAALLRRRNLGAQPQLAVGLLSMDLVHREAALGSVALHLTPTEFAILAELCAHAGRVVTQSWIAGKVWPAQQADCGEALRVHITHLRKKLGQSGVRIANEPGVGYRLEIPQSTGGSERAGL
jgi:two-component system KDP operon response regulator KdpE